MLSLQDQVDPKASGLAQDGRQGVRICVVIPCFKVGEQIFKVLAAIPGIVSDIIVVDDACPEQTGQRVCEADIDPRITVITHEVNQGVGGAVLTGIESGLERGADILVKIDGDGQMDPRLIASFVGPIQAGMADYTKGNRFYYLESSMNMPLARKIGNLGLTFITRISTGYYSVSDPTNGYFAIDGRLARQLPVHKIARRYFFETDMLFRLNTLRGRVLDIPHEAHYGDEQSGLSARKELLRFAKLHAKVTAKRLFYNYVLRDFSMGSVFLLAGFVFNMIGLFGGVNAWWSSQMSGIPRSGGEIAILEVSIILGAMFTVGFFNFDINEEPKTPISRLLGLRSSVPLKQFED